MHMEMHNDVSLLGEMEWSVVDGGRVVVAKGADAWLQPLIPGTPFAQPMPGVGAPAVTGTLLDAVTRVGWAAVPDGPRQRFTLARWLVRLCALYQTTHATPIYMAVAAERFRAAGREHLAQWAQTKIREESGHDRLALRDLESLGYAGQAMVEAVVPSAAAGLVDYFARAAQSEDPIACVGYAYGLERLALCIDEAFIARVDACLPAGVDGTRCLRVHSSTGSDAKHVAELVEFVASLTGPERSSVARACYETAVLCRQPDQFEALSDEAILEQLHAFKHN